MMQPLEGVKVLDLTHMLAGPTCTNMLALLGAEVVKIERPGSGDLYRRYSGLPDMNVPFAAANTGKKSVALNLRDPQARTAIHALIARSDLLVENFRPGALKKLGLDWDSVRTVNPRLVYCSISGFGHTGPLVERGGLDQILQAMSGMMWLSGEPGDGPVKVGFPIADVFTGYMSVIGILAALRRRDARGVGEFVDVAMLDCTLKLMGKEIADYIDTGEPTQRTGNRGYRLVATSDTYCTRDGYLTLGANQQEAFQALCRVLGCEELVRDPRFADYDSRVSNSDALRAILTAHLRDCAALELETQLSAAGVPAAMVRTLGDVIAEPHVASRGLLRQTDVPGHGKPVSVVGAPFRLEGGVLDVGRVPTLGEHTGEVLQSLGFDQAAIDRLT
jgi:CoA:oxalate CoA-transferase